MTILTSGIFGLSAVDGDDEDDDGILFRHFKTEPDPRHLPVRNTTGTVLVCCAHMARIEVAWSLYLHACRCFYIGSLRFAVSAAFWWFYGVFGKGASK